ncbi:leucine-rich repeat-containing protein 37A-like [Crotalus adamanteus]|uniref:Leucine-rich repeat-containing protein 37A-like n=1 Tax=Crotalus adamanteus TaxID=8729 RepID=A0AAW1B4V2_CROAD
MNKRVWWAYPWTEYLILKNNHLHRLDNTSLDGLLSLTHLDVSHNQIQTIEKNAFEPVPLLQSINLSGNHILRITQGAFQAWHGMQFLSKLILNHNPLREIGDSHFYKLPSLKFLDLGSTEITTDILENLLKISLKLKTLILPRKMSCCLCKNQDTIEALSNTIKLDCTNRCVSNIIDYEKEELWGTMQDEVKKMACAKLSSRIDLLMKDFNVKSSQETPALWNFYFSPPKNVNDMIAASSRKMDKLSDEIPRQGISQSRYYKKLMLGISMATTMVVIVEIIVLIKYVRSNRRGNKGTSKKVSSREEDEENLLYFDHT